MYVGIANVKEPARQIIWADAEKKCVKFNGAVYNAQSTLLSLLILLGGSGHPPSLKENFEFLGLLRLFLVQFREKAEEFTVDDPSS